MNILLINGSPRGKNSNTLKLSQAFCDGIIQNTNATLEVLDLNRLNINDCLGCFSCWKDTPGICCIKDDMKDCLEKVKQADILVWSFPLYFFLCLQELRHSSTDSSRSCCLLWTKIL